MTDVRTSSIAPPGPLAGAATAGAPSDGVSPRPVAGRGPARPSAAPVHLTAVTLFAGFCALFAARMVAGDDPALGLQPGALAAPAPPGILQKVVVTRRIRVDGLTRAQIRRRGVDRIVVVRRRAPVATATIARVTAAEGAPSRTPAIAGATSQATTDSRRSTSGSGGSTVVADRPSGPQATEPNAAAPAPAAASPAPAPVAAPAPVPVIAPPPIATAPS